VIPDGILALLPFEALVAGGKPVWKKGGNGYFPSGVTYLGDIHPISYYQSLTALTLGRKLPKKDKPAERLLVFADPVFQRHDPRARKAKKTTIARKENEFVIKLMKAAQRTAGGAFNLSRLPDTAELADRLRALFGDAGDVYTGFDASKKKLLEEIAPDLDKYGTLVFATHGLINGRLIGLLEPALALTTVPAGTDGFLTMTEVMELNLNADLAALTACQTGLGKTTAGEGVMSMGRAFLCSGARSVLMSLWSVSEEASVALMKNFFTNAKHGMSRRDAWEKARKDLRAAGYEHPFFWASFVLVGEVN
jgi:CHAT domain-containing protein